MNIILGTEVRAIRKKKNERKTKQAKLPAHCEFLPRKERK